MGKKEDRIIIDAIKEASKYYSDGINKFKDAISYIEEKSFAEASLRLSDAVDSFHRAAESSECVGTVKMGSVTSMGANYRLRLGEILCDYDNDMADLAERLRSALKKYKEWSL